jgi:hypothetical protein
VEVKVCIELVGFVGRHKGLLGWRGVKKLFDQKRGYTKKVELNLFRFND